MLRLTLGSICLAVGLLGSSAVLTGCGDATPPGESAHTGTLSAALTTTGSDGASYTFPAGSYLVVQSMTTGDFIPLDGTNSVLQRKLPAGTYTATLYYSGGSVVLTRTLGSDTNTIDAEWTNAQPVTFDIVDKQSTALVLHFKVKGLADLTFATGTLQVSVDVVQDGVDQPNHAQASGTANVFEEDYADPTAQYASGLDVDTGVDYQYHLAFEATGDWVQSGSTSVCKYGNLTVCDASGGVGISRRAAELVGGSGYICIYDEGANDYLVLGGSRSGAPPAGQDTFLPDASYNFYVSVAGSLGDIFDGTTLKQSMLQTPTALTGSYSHYLYDSTFSTVLSQVQANSTGTIQLLP